MSAPGIFKICAKSQGFFHYMREFFSLKDLIIKSAATMTVDNALSVPLKINEGPCDAQSKQRE